MPCMCRLQLIIRFLPECKACISAHNFTCWGTDGIATSRSCWARVRVWVCRGKNIHSSYAREAKGCLVCRKKLQKPLRSILTEGIWVFRVTESGSTRLECVIGGVGDSGNNCEACTIRFRSTRWSASSSCTHVRAHWSVRQWLLRTEKEFPFFAIVINRRVLWFTGEFRLLWTHIPFLQW